MVSNALALISMPLMGMAGATGVGSRSCSSVTAVRPTNTTFPVKERASSG